MTKTKTNEQRLPELLQRQAAHESNLRDLLGALRDQIRIFRERKDPDTGKSVADLIADEKRALNSLAEEIKKAWQFPHQTNMDL